ncbi:uncharacterized protein B0H18DRAFT_1093567 [Fomitopsis serialis]|uniref:uncharacterized protein n=1 Tax=Fomitopsis serialis TaxID=139415 RepID=UPI002007B8B5|nr:uncharacterized protein B0H18DRAFT_1093567 [Neoantrodia serialis]KAH9930687.1 hypothetical protein B0H18DRAFT_1093567 [Neoantrodia serialis]
MTSTQCVDSIFQSEASDLYDKTWGRQWPQHSNKIVKTDVVTTGHTLPINGGAALNENDESGSVDKDADYVYGDGADLAIPEELRYDVLIIRDEYVQLRKMMEEGNLRDKRAIVVVGQPGIGKTTFLLYLLLHRLERRLPTAVQLSPHFYNIFDEEGATARAINKCWALSDSNTDIVMPCAPFRNRAKFVIQATSPRPERWKEWLKQKMGRLVISALPKVLEIGAILKELQFDPSSTLCLVRKWGPSIRNIICITEDLLARASAVHICADPLSVNAMSGKGRKADSEGSNLVFLRPHREAGDLWQSVPFIPTKYLSDIFEEYRSRLSNDRSLQLFRAFSPHSYTRAPGGWVHETNMHARLSRGAPALRIFRDQDEKEMLPSSHLLPGTAAGIKTIGVRDSFYWFPCVSNFPGIDGVLGDTDGNIYTVQATIAEEHPTPVEGLQEVWRRLKVAVRTSRTWHFVLVADRRTVADTYVERFSEKLDGLTLGPAGARVPVHVWGCVL